MLQGAAATATAAPATKPAKALDGCETCPARNSRHWGKSRPCVPAPCLPSIKSESSKIFWSAQPARLQGLLLHPIKPGGSRCAHAGAFQPQRMHVTCPHPPKCNPPPQNKQHAIKDHHGRTSAACVVNTARGHRPADRRGRARCLKTHLAHCMLVDPSDRLACAWVRTLPGNATTRAQTPTAPHKHPAHVGSLCSAPTIQHDNTPQTNSDQLPNTSRKVLPRNAQVASPAAVRLQHPPKGAKSVVFDSQQSDASILVWTAAAKCCCHWCMDPPRLLLLCAGQHVPGPATSTHKPAQLSTLPAGRAQLPRCCTAGGQLLPAQLRQPHFAAASAAVLAWLCGCMPPGPSS